MSIYRKIHLFNINIAGRAEFQESDFMLPGNEVRVTPTGVGRVGQTICYDLRFPELFRSLSAGGAQLVAVPSAFTMTTGRDHWEVLLRARAIENQMYVVAPDQCGRHTPKLQTYGRSVIIDPWGTVLATAPEGEGVIVAEVNYEREEEIRTNLPALKHRREFLTGGGFGLTESDR